MANDIIENYDDRTPSELENEISDADFSEDELEELREYEESNEGRGMVLDTINAELAAFETEEADASDFVTEAQTAEVAAEETDEVDVTDAETEVEHGEPMETDDEDDGPEYVDIKSDGHHYAGGHFFDEIQGEKKENVRYNARVKDAEEKGRLKVLK